LSPSLGTKNQGKSKKEKVKKAWQG